MDLIDKLRKDFPAVTFEHGETFRWSPQSHKITYKMSDKDDVWAAFHELGHAVLGHKQYSSDFELLRLEVSAWDQACKIAQDYGHSIGTDHIQNCLDTYREWLHRRSTCPQCNSRSLQQSATLYHCFNCQTDWKVTASRFCRPYRQSVLHPNKKSPAQSEQTTFI